jgi:hypothetical protein
MEGTGTFVQFLFFFDENLQIDMDTGQGFAEDSSPLVMQTCDVVFKEEVEEMEEMKTDGFPETESCQVFIKEEVQEDHVKKTFEPAVSCGDVDPLAR